MAQLNGLIHIYQREKIMNALGLAPWVAVSIFVVMFVLIILDKIERHVVTLGAERPRCCSYLASAWARGPRFGRR